MKHKIRVVVVDDHTLFRQGIVGLLGGQADIEIVGEAASGSEAIEVVAATTPDVVLMDIAMPGLSGLEAAREVKARREGVEVLMLTMHDREDYLFQALRAGAAGYILKGADVQELLAAVRAARHRGMYLYPAARERLVADYLRRTRQGEKQVEYDGLTDREREVLALIAQGKTTPEIARELFLSPHTVQTHRDRIMAKLDLHSKAGLIRYAISKGLIDI